jgi:hypothetical protein
MILGATLKKFVGGLENAKRGKSMEYKELTSSMQVSFSCGTPHFR